MLVDLLLPLRCAACQAPGAVLCPVCAAQLRPAPDAVPPPGLASCRALFAYDGTARCVVLGLKHRVGRRVLVPLARGLAELAGPVHPATVVTWAPTSPARRRARGHDQAEELARAVGAALDRPVRRLLRRGADAPQEGRDAAARRLGPHLRPAGRVPPRVLVVDDVVTTGATLGAAAGALHAGGALVVDGLALARTPAWADRLNYATAGPPFLKMADRSADVQI